MFNRLRDYLEMHRVLPSRSRTRSRTVRQPLVDAKFSYRPSPEEEWTVEGQHVMLNGRSVADLLEEWSLGDCCHLIDALSAYREWVLHRKVPRQPRVREAIDGALERVLKRVHRGYTQHMHGLQIRLEDERVMLNNLDIRAVLSMFRARPTEKAKRFLQGVQRKLALIIAREHDNPKTTRAASVVRSVYHDLSHALTRDTIDQLRLPARSRSGAGQSDCA